MAMDFMEPREPFLNKLIPFAGVAIIVALLALCQNAWTDARSPQLRMHTNNPHLQRSAGVLYLDGQPYNGWLDSFYPDGLPERSTPYINGKEDGLMQSWYPNRELEQQRTFRNGKKEGIHRGWWPGGRLKFEYEFDNDEHNGTAKEWYSSGQICRAFHYTEGHEDGLEQMWWDDGSIRANYVVKDGQQYGLIGRKLCKNSLKQP